MFCTHGMTQLEVRVRSSFLCASKIILFLPEYTDLHPAADDGGTKVARRQARVAVLQVRRLHRKTAQRFLV